MNSQFQLHSLPNLAEQLASPDEERRLQAIQTLATVEAPEAERMLIGALGDDSWRVRRAAVDGLAQRKGASLASSLLRSLREEHCNPSILNGVLQVLAYGHVDITSALIDCLNAAEVDLRVYAALALGKQSDRRGIPALIGALQDPEANVRYHAIDSLGHLRATEAVEALVAIAQSGDFFLAFPALEALSEIGDPSVAPKLLPLLEYRLLCTAVVEALGQLKNASVIPSLIESLNQPDAPVRAIVKAIANLYDSYETDYREGDYIADLARSAIAPSGIQNILNALPEANPDELRALVILLGQVQGNDVERALTQLLSQETVRSSVVEALVRHGKRVTEFLIQQLMVAEELEVRQAVAIALGRIGDARAVPALISLLTTEPELIVPTAGALAQIGDSRAFEPLLNLLGHPDAAVRQAAIAALSSLGHPGMPTRLVDSLQDVNPYTRESAVKIAGYFAFTELESLLLKRCRDDNENVRRAAIEMIPYLDNEQVLPTLVAALKNETPKVRAAAAKALGQVENSLAFTYLLGTLKDPDLWVRYYGARALGWHGYPEAVDALAQLATEDPAPPVRISAIEALGRIGGARAVRVLASLVEAPDGEDNEDVVRTILSALGQIAHPNSLAPLLSVLRLDSKASSERRIWAIRALGKRGGVGVANALYSLAAADPLDSVVQAAIDALADLATPEAIASLLELTTNPRCRKACVTALAALGIEQIEAIGDGFTHSQVGVRRAVVEVLTRMKHPQASEQLIMALDDPDPAVRCAAVTSLKNLGSHYADKKLALLANTDPDPKVRHAAQM